MCEASKGSSFIPAPLGKSTPRVYARRACIYIAVRLPSSGLKARQQRDLKVQTAADANDDLVPYLNEQIGKGDSLRCAARLICRPL